MRGLDPRIHLRIELRFRAMDCRHRRAEATPSFGRLCPAMTLMLRIAIHIQLSNSERVCVRILAARCARALRRLPPSERRGRRESRVRAAPAVSCANMHKKTHTSIQVQRRQSGFPCAVVYGLFRALPGDRAFLPPSPLRSLLLKNLTPASGCQDHTASPSATTAFVIRRHRVHRIPPRVRDDREPPLSSGETREAKALICPTG
jgi:hypothetical protein